MQKQVFCLAVALLVVAAGAQPGIQLIKYTNGVDANTPPGPVVAVGSTVTWTYEVTNTGTVILTDIKVTDDRVGTIGFITQLEPGTNQTLSMTGTAVAGQYGNMGTASANIQGLLVADTDPSHYFGASPALQIIKYTNDEDAKAPPGPMLIPGSTVKWSYEVTNTGNVTLTAIQVHDDKEGWIGTIPSLAAGASQTLDKTGTAAAGQYANYGQASATYAGTPLWDDDPSHYYGAQPDLRIRTFTNDEDANTPPGPMVAVGSTVKWSYEVTNTGNVTLTDIKVTDDREGFVGKIDWLMAGASQTLDKTGTAIPGQYANVGMAATTFLGTPVVKTDPSHYFGASPALQIIKYTNDEDANAPPGPMVMAGSTVKWSYEVTNTGNVTLTAIQVHDDKEGWIGTIPSLAAGASQTLDRTGTAAAGQYANYGQASATYAGTPVWDDDPSHYFGEQPNESKSIRDIQYTTLASGDSPLKDQIVTVSGVVTAETYAFGKKYYFIQDANAPWSGIKVADTVNVAAQGDKVTLTGTVVEYLGCTQIQDVSAFSIDSTNITRIVPAVVTTGEIATDSVNAEAYEGCLVQVKNVTITGAVANQSGLRQVKHGSFINTDLDSGEWQINDSSGVCRVGEAAPYYFDPKKYSGARSITGVLDYTFNNTKIEPRLAYDIVEDGPYTRLQRIQQVRHSDLLKAPKDGISDKSYMLNDTVTVRGLVTMPTGLSNAGAGIKFIFCEPEGGPWSALLSCNADATDYPSLFEGDEIEMTGYIGESSTTRSNMTELLITSPIKILNAGLPLPKPDSVSTGALRVPETAEQWGNVMVKIGNSMVAVKTSSDYLFSVDDGTGLVFIDDDSDSLYRKYTSPPSGQTALPKPPVGTAVESIRGWVYHHDGTYTDSTDYKLTPLYLTDMVFGSGLPMISKTIRDLAVPKSTEPVTVTTIVEATMGIKSVKLFYKIGQGNYSELTMTLNGGVYQAAIPAQANGSFVSYYIEAVDNMDQRTTDPADNKIGNHCYPVRDGSLTIADIQNTPWPSGDSPLQGQKVAVRGVVTVDTTFFIKYGAYAIQDREGAWNGLFILGNVPALFRGDEVLVYGKVDDHNATYLDKWEGNTQIIADSLRVLNKGNPLPAAVKVRTGDLGNLTASAESYEGVLVRVESSTLTKINRYDVSIDDGSGECLLGADGFIGRDPGPNPFFYINQAGNYLVIGVDTLHAGAQFSPAQGAFLFSFGTHKIEIRAMADIGSTTSVESPQLPPLQFALEQNYPNPFNPETRIYFQLPRAQEVKLIIYNIHGQIVRRLVEGVQPSGQHVVNWDGCDLNGGRVPSGLYIYRIITDRFIAHRKMLLVQ